MSWSCGITKGNQESWPLLLRYTLRTDVDAALGIQKIEGPTPPPPLQTQVLPKADMHTPRNKRYSTDCCSRPSQSHWNPCLRSGPFWTLESCTRSRAKRPLGGLVWPSSSLAWSGLKIANERRCNTPQQCPKQKDEKVWGRQIGMSFCTMNSGALAPLAPPCFPKFE